MTCNGLQARWAAGILAVATVLPMFLAISAVAAVPTMSVSPNLIEIQGGSARGSWALRFATQSRDFSKHFLIVSDERAYFSHGSWLRFVDLRNGKVLGRWRYPADIIALHAEKRQEVIRVEIEDKDGSRVVRKSFTFDPAAPELPEWNQGSLLLYNLARREATLPSALPDDTLRQMAERDKYSPWFAFTLGKSLLDTDSAAAQQALADAARTPTHWSDRLQLSAALENLGQRRLAAETFDAAYADYIRAGNDPRLLLALIGRLVVYGLDWSKVRPSDRLAVAEQLYRVAPYIEASDLAWPHYAEEMEKNGDAAAAATWRARAAETSAHSAMLFAPHHTLMVDRLLLLWLGGILAAPVFLLAQWLRYRAQRKLDGARRNRWATLFHGLTYWTRRERLAFFSIIVVLWYLSGLLVIMSTGILRQASFPIHLLLGNFRGPIPHWFLQQGLPESPATELLRAIASHQNGDLEAAERLYRRNLHYPEAWNNLGVLLQQRGRPEEARKAYEQALAGRTDFPEAALNLGRPPSSTWTEAHHRYRPGEPMMAPPSRSQMMEAIHGGTPAQLAWKAWIAVADPGNLASPRKLGRDLAGLIGPSEQGNFVGLAFAVYILVAVLSLALLLVIPYRDVTQAPTRAYGLLEWLLPGLARAWTPLGGVVLLLSASVLLYWSLQWAFGTAAIVSAIAVPNLTRSFGTLPTEEHIWRAFDLPWTFSIALPLVLVTLNVLLVLRDRKAGSGAAAVSSAAAGQP